MGEEKEKKERERRKGKRRGVRKGMVESVKPRARNGVR